MHPLIDALGYVLGPAGAAFALAAIGINLQIGYAGILNFGQAGFMLVGAYGVAVSVDRLGLSFWISCGVAIIASIAMALLLGLPTLRLRADYFAITSLALAEVLRLVSKSEIAEPVSGGVNGIQAFANDFFDVNPFAFGYYGFGPLRWTEQQMWVLTVGWGLAVLSVVTVWILIKSPWGRVVQAIRDDEFVPRSLGKNVFAYKVQVVVIGGVFGSLGGIVLAASQQDVHSDTYLSVVTFFALASAILGGLGSISGPVVGTLVFWGVITAADSGIRGAVSRGLLDPDLFTGQRVAATRFIIAGLILILVLVVRPQGILGGANASIMRARKPETQAAETVEESP